MQMFVCAFDKPCHFKGYYNECACIKTEAKPFPATYEDCPFRVTEEQFEENKRAYPFKSHYIQYGDHDATEQ